jgi:DNA-directed RNA polymerase subunit H (RpoH/RPB5)
MPSIQKSQSGNKDIDSSKLDTKQGLAKNSQNITKREQLEKLMAKEADPTAIPKIEKGNDSVNNTKSPEANKNFFTKSIEIVFNTLDKRLLKPIIKLAQQITGFKTSNKVASSENVEDPEKAKLIQEIANRKLDLSKVKDLDKRQKIEALQKRLGDEGLKLNTETKGALVEIIRGAETKGEFNQAALPDCCRVVVNDSADTKAAIEKTTMRLLDRVDRDDSSESLIGKESSPADIKITPSEVPAASLVQIPNVLKSLLNTVKEDVKARVAAGSLTSAQGELFDQLMANPNIQKNIDGYYNRSGAEEVASFFGTLIERELPDYTGGQDTSSKYVEWIKQVTDQGIKVTTVSSLSMNSNPLVTIELYNGPETKKKAEEIIKKGKEIDGYDEEVKKHTKEVVTRLMKESPEFAKAVQEGNLINLCTEISTSIREGKIDALIKEKYSSESTAVKGTSKIQVQNTPVQTSNEKSEHKSLQTPIENSTSTNQEKIQVTTIIDEAPSNNMPAEQEKTPEIEISAQEISPTVISHQEDKLLAASSELHL